MNKDTPLTEVAEHLPGEISAVLLHKSHGVRTRAVSLIRSAVVAMEGQGAQLDPVSYRAVVYGIGLVAICAADYSEALDQITQTAEKARQP